MLRHSVTRCARSVHTSSIALAPKKATKVSAQGFKRGGSDGKANRKTGGSFRFFEDHIHASRYHKTSPSDFSQVAPFDGALQQGSVLRFTELQKQRLTQCGSFKKDQFNELFPTPVTLVRSETKEVEAIVQSAFTSPSSQNRVCIIGERGIGKSTLLAQSLALASQNQKAVIIPIPHALRLIDGSNDYSFDTKLNIYTQPMYTKTLLDKIRYANAKTLQNIKISKERVIESHSKGRASTKFNTQHTLADLLRAKIGARQRGQVLQILIEELQAQSDSPVFVAVDNFSALTASPKTAYRNTENQPLFHDDFQITNLILQLTSGEKSFQKGAVILATSGDDRETLTLSAGLGLATPDPYTSSYSYNGHVASRLAGVKPLQVGKLSKENVGSIVGVLAQAGAIRKDELERTTFEQLTAQKYVLSGNGNPLELFRSVVMYL